MKVIDTVLPPAKTALEEWSRWANRIQTKMLTTAISDRKIIEVKQMDEDEDPYSEES